MLHHHKGTSGYARLYLILFFGITLLTLLLAGLCSNLGLTAANQIAGGVIFAALWGCGFVVMQRFVLIEKRRPTISEGNAVGLKSIFYVVAIIACLALLIGSIVIMVMLIRNGLNAFGGSVTVEISSTGEQNTQQNPALMVALGTMVLLYLAPFLNLAIISRFVAPRSKAA